MVYVKKENKIQEFLKHLNDHLSMFKQRITGLEGITLNGGLARGYGDHLSEVDLTFFLSNEAYKNWNYGKAPICTGICVYDGLIYDIKFLNYETELARNLSPIVELWDLSFAKILHDPKGKIKDFKDTKLNNNLDIQSISGIMFETWWYYRLAGDIWIYREDPCQGHLLLNEAIKGLLRAIFIANERYVPHEKWLFHYCRDLKWLPLQWETKRQQLVSTGDLSINSLKNRQNLIHSIWSEINSYVRERYFNGVLDDITTKKNFDLIKLLSKSKKIAIGEWAQISSLRALNEDPLQKFVFRKGNWVVFDEEAFLNLKSEAMYDWHFKAVRNARNER
jgi:hypothetical protein